MPEQLVLERRFDQVDFDRFAALSGDDNPIHVDAGFAANTRFGRPVAHGLLLLSVLRGLVAQLVPDGRVVHQAVVFPAPTFAGEAMQFSAFVSSTDTDGIDVRLQVRRVECGTVTCEGNCRVVS